jgi:hypothetical protein
MAHGVTPAFGSGYQDRDNLVRAAVLIVDAGVVRYSHECSQELTWTQLPALAHAACLVSRSLAEMILEPAAWRVTALVGTAQLLSAWMRPNAAAISSASLVRDFEERLRQPVGVLDEQMTKTVAAAIRCAAEGMVVASAIIARSLACKSTRGLEHLLVPPLQITLAH